MLLPFNFDPRIPHYTSVPSNRPIMSMSLLQIIEPARVLPASDGATFLQR
jgi:hypothetical protein